MRKCRKKMGNGFTLVELLVVIVILGIIVALSIPLIRNIKANNKNRKFDTYERTLVDSAKLYTDSYSVDMFGNSNYGCVEISYADLKKKSLIKDIQVSDATCEDAKTYVRVIKLNDKYAYETFLTCSNKKNNEKIFKSDKISDKTMECNGGAMTTGPTIEFKPTLDPEVRAKNSTKNKNVKVVVHSSYGLSADSSFYYAWSKKADGSDLTTASWKQKKMGNDNLDKIGYSKTFDFNTNKLATGDYYLFVRTVDNNGEYSLKDGAGNANEQTMYHAGPYVVDKTKPNISTVGVMSTDAWNSVNIKVSMNSAKDDVNLTDLRVCLTQGSKTCLDKDFVESAKAKLTLTGVSYNGATTQVNVFVRDLAGNESKQVVNYTLYKECETANLVKTTLKANGSCSKKCGGGTRTDVYNSKDKNSNNACAGKTVSVPNVACNTMACCSKTTVSCGSWNSWGGCSKKCGTGSQSRTRTCSNVSAYDGSYCSANTAASNTTETQSCNTQDCCSSIRYVSGTNCTKKCGGGTSNLIAYSAYDNSRCSSKDKTSGGNACNTQTCCSKVTYKDGTSCSKTCGGGTHNRLAYSAYDGSRCSGSDQKSGGGACNTQGCCSKVTYKNGTSCSKTCGGGTYNRLAYSAYDGSRCSGSDQKSGGGACNKQSCCKISKCGNTYCWNYAAANMGGGANWNNGKLELCTGNGTGCVKASNSSCGKIGGTYFYFKYCP